MINFSFFRTASSSETQKPASSWQKKGQGLVEYAVILALIAVVTIVSLTAVGKKSNNTFNAISASVPTSSAVVATAVPGRLPDGASCTTDSQCLPTSECKTSKGGGGKVCKPD